MAKKDGELIVSNGTPTAQSQTISLVPLLGLVLIGSALYKSGYHLGERAAKQMLKRHDKDVRAMEKRMKRQYRDYDLVKKEKPKKKWFFW